MIFWIVAGLMAVIVAAALIVPLLRATVHTTDANDYDVEVYKDQIAELDREHSAGQLTDDQAAAARAEIARRLLAADNRRKASQEQAGEGGQARSRLTVQLTAFVIAVAVPGAALTIYAQLGTPGLPGAPFLDRASDRQNTESVADIADLNTLAVRLANRLAAAPGSLEDWLLLAQTYMTLQRHGKAAQAFKQALGLDPNNAGLYSAYGEALTLAAGGTVTPAARSAFEKALRRDPAEVGARYYSGLASYQRGDRVNALDQWAALIADSPADASWLSIVRSRAEDAARSLGLDAASVLPSQLPATASAPASTTSTTKGPTADDVAAAAAMSPEERAQMIEGMIEGLAARLEENPREFDGWLRLIRAYAVIKQQDKAEVALSSALANFAKAPFPRQQLIALGRELGLATAVDTSTARGPTAEQVADAQQLPAAERTAMIEGMVASLAARLEDEPNDTEGWIRLARSYDVLKRPKDTRDALARAAALNPDNVDILTFYARALRATRGGKSSGESIAVMRKVLTLSPNSVEALWFVAQVEIAAGNIEIANAHLQRALAVLPTTSADRPQIKRAIEALDGG
jgi:cytochrome c-type biogenesis protein CcmH